MGSIVRTAVQLIYPRRCAICGEIVKEEDGLIHAICRMKLTFLKEPKCVKCGKMVDTSEQEYCFDCRKKNYHYIKGFPLLKYDKLMSKSIADFKYKGKREYVDFYIEEILRAYQTELKQIRPDVLIPIPVHSSKLRERGFNQAELIAVGLGKHLDIPVESHLIIRTRKTLPQKELDDKERLKNLEMAFVMNDKANLDNIHKVVLVDDIYTTGSTIEACTKVLNQYGIKGVYYISVCIGQGF